MATSFAFKDIIDLPEWRPLSHNIATSASGSNMCSDMRNTEVRDPYIYFSGSNTVFYRYHVKNDAWQALPSPALTTTFGAGSGSVCAPARGPRGTLTAVTSNTVMTLSALPAAVGLNQLANRGDGIGYKIRIIGNAGGSAGLTEEKLIVASTSSGTGTTTPTITLDSALTFLPIVGDTYELLSGRIYLLGASTLGANSWRIYDIATNSFSSGSTTNLVTIGTDSSLVALDEQYVPAANLPGEGFLLGTGGGGVGGKALTATGSGAGTLTGQAIGGDAGVLLNEYRNFQIRIVKDVAKPTAVGQRVKISSHLAGPSPVYTTAAWPVTTPSANAEYVIENTNEILLWTAANVNTFTYNQDLNTWSTATYAARSVAMAAGCCSFQNFAPALDTGKTYRYSHIYSLRGSATTMDLLDVAAGVSGAWTLGITYGGSGNTPANGGCTYDPINGYCYMNYSSLSWFMRYSGKANVMEPWATLRHTQSTALVGNRMASIVFVDGSTKATFIYAHQSTGQGFYNILAQR